MRSQEGLVVLYVYAIDNIPKIICKISMMPPRHGLGWASDKFHADVPTKGK